ncbi:MAG: acyltransferase [Bacteroidales bacterium]|nr:acyltransferase [Bacteroidales bacterium]
MQTKISVNRNIFLDFLKVLAIFLVVANHCVDNVTPIERAEPWYNMWGSIYNSFTRPAIPLFVMVTGILLLPVKIGMLDFYKKKTSRLVIPFLFWSILYNLFPWITGLLHLEPNIINLFFKWVEPTQEFIPSLKNILMIPFGFSYYAIQMWYVYMLIGLYLYLPIFSAWVEKSTKKEQQIFLIIWFISLFIPYLRNYLMNDLWGVCSWNEFGLLYYFAGFSGYMLLGYYLMNNTIRITKMKRYLISFFSFIVGYFITFIGFKQLSGVEGQSEALVELFFTFCSPNVALMTFGIFFGLQNIKFDNISVNNIIIKFAGAVFGIWMCHYLFVGPIFLLFAQLSIPVLIKLLLSTIVTVIVSFLLVIIIKGSGRIGKKIMG